MKTVLITGGTGLIGNFLSQMLEKKGYKVLHLSRRECLDSQYPAYGWNISKKFINPKALEQTDCIIHLAGASLADKRWTAKRKAEILDSRIASLALLHEGLSQLDRLPETFISCSAVGYYGNTGDRINEVGEKPGQDFMSKICEDWENASEPIRKLGIRTPILRSGVVLSTKGGALQKMLPSYKFRIGGYFGNGQQYYSWIHLVDICRIFIRILEDESLSGIYNGAAPVPVTQQQLAASIAKALGKKSILMPIPAFVMKILLGEMSSILLNSSRAVPSGLLKAGFEFNHPQLVPAIEDLIKQKI